MTLPKLLLAIIVGFFMGILIQHVRADNSPPKDWQGVDKVQHMWIGAGSAGLCTAVDNKPQAFNTRCFLLSEGYGLAVQLYALKTNPSKIRREAAYDFLAHTIGATLGTYATQHYLVGIEPQKGGGRVMYARSF
jgi:hypothetical protein